MTEMSSFRSFALLGLFPILVGGCRQAEEASPDLSESEPAHTEQAVGISGTLDFECREEQAFTLSIAEDGESATLQREEVSQTVQRIPTETGARFGANGLEVWLADPEGAFIVEDSVMTYQDCARIESE